MNQFDRDFSEDTELIELTPQLSSEPVWDKAEVEGFEEGSLNEAVALAKQESVETRGESFFCKILTSFRCLVALEASIILWVGAWNLLTCKKDGFVCEIYALENPDGYIWSNRPPNWAMYAIPLEPNFTREILYIFSGILLVFLTGTLYENAGFSGSYLNLERIPIGSEVLGYNRLILSLMGSFLLWTGCYNIISLFFIVNSEGQTISYPDHPPTHIVVFKDWSLFLFGMLLLFVTDTWFNMAFIWPPWFSDPPLSPEDPKMAHGRQICRALFSIVGQNCIWVGMWNITEYHFGLFNSGDGEGTYPWSIYRQVIYVLTGILTMVLTSSLLDNAWLDSDAADFGNSEQILLISSWRERFTRCCGMRSFRYFYMFGWYLYAFIGLSGQLLHNSGMWVLLDSYVFPMCRGRNYFYCLLGFILLLCTGSARGNAGITPVAVNIKDRNLEHVPFVDRSGGFVSI